jgi:hypothetical protein
VGSDGILSDTVSTLVSNPIDTFWKGGPVDFESGISGIYSILTKQSMDYLIIK